MKFFLRWLVLLASVWCVGAARAQDDVVQLRVMTFNIWRGGELVDFGKVVEAIQAADADVVGVQEAEGNLRHLADALGWPHISERTHIISKYPIIDPPGGKGHYVLIQTYPGQVFAMANLHLPSDPYGPYLIRDGETMEAVMQNERETRLAALEPLLAAIDPLLEDGIPLVVTGDFNTPSHRDWTAAMTAVRPQNTVAVEWPVTLAAEAIGLVDTYRAVYPDPSVRIGMTWTPGYPVPRLNENEIVDRIDYVFAAPNIEVVDADIVGERGGQDVDIEIHPFPSDHRGMVATLRIAPVEPPLFVAPERRRVVVGEEIVVRYHAPNGENSDRIGIVPAGGAVDADLIMSIPPYEASFFGSVTFGSSALEPGEYEAVLLDGEGEALARSGFWVVAPGALPALTTDAERYAADDVLTVTWENAPALKWDWIGVYAAGDPDLYNYYDYAYTAASVAGAHEFDLAALALEPGEYELRLMLDDGFRVLASARFSVTP